MHGPPWTDRQVDTAFASEARLAESAQFIPGVNSFDEVRPALSVLWRLVPLVKMPSTSRTCPLPLL